jgi:hypothetical protein
MAATECDGFGDYKEYLIGKISEACDGDTHDLDGQSIEAKLDKLVDHASRVWNAGFAISKIQPHTASFTLINKMIQCESSILDYYKRSILELENIRYSGQTKIDVDNIIKITFEAVSRYYIPGLHHIEDLLYVPSICNLL